MSLAASLGVKWENPDLRSSSPPHSMDNRRPAGDLSAPTSDGEISRNGPRPAVDLESVTWEEAFECRVSAKQDCLQSHSPSQGISRRDVATADKVTQ